nr:hypothetical protein [Tanacetum cinerariifolium]
MSSDSHATITYTSMSSYEVIFNGYFEMPMDPLDPYAQLVMKAPPSPDYVPGSEAPPSPDYIPGPEYPEYLPPADDVFPAKEQPLPAPVSPTAESPGYIADLEPEMEPEEEDGDDEKSEGDSIDYPTSRGDDDPDDDGDDLSEDDADDEDEEESSDSEEEEEEHLALTVPAPALHSFISASEDSDQTEPFEEGETVATPPPSTYRITARISVRPHIPIPFPSKEGIPEADMPLRKKARFTTPTGGYEIMDYCQSQEVYTSTLVIQIEALQRDVCTLQGQQIDDGMKRKVEGDHHEEKVNEKRKIYSFTLELRMTPIKEISMNRESKEDDERLSRQIKWVSQLRVDGDHHEVKVNEKRKIHNLTLEFGMTPRKEKSMNTEKMDQQNLTLAKIPILDTGKFEQWQFKIQQYLQHEHYALWEVIEFRDSYEAPKDDVATCSTNEGTGKKKGRTVALTTEDIQKRKNDEKARTTLLLAFPDEHQLRFSKYKTAQELWDAILNIFGGNEATKKMKKNLLKQQYENFKAEGSKTLEQTFNRLQAIVSHLEFMDIEIKQDDLNQKFLTIKNSSGNEEVNTDSIPIASTYVSPASTNIRAASISQDTACAYIALRSNGSQIKFEDITQIDEDDMEEMDIK